jgi:DNA-binding CsgD family transcriptional regulator
VETLKCSSGGNRAIPRVKGKLMSSSNLGRDLLAIARVEYRRGSVQTAWEAVTEVAALARSTGDAVLLADAALVITAPPVAAWSFSAQRHQLCSEALAAIENSDPERAARLRDLIEVTRSPWSKQPSPSRDDEVGAWDCLQRLDTAYRLGNRLELDADMMTLESIVRRLGSPSWRWRLALAHASIALMDGHMDDVPVLRERASQLGMLAGVEEAPYLDLVLRSSMAVQTGDALVEIEREVRRALVGTPLFAQGWHARVLMAMGRTEDALAIWRALLPRLSDLPSDSLEWLVAVTGVVELCVAARDRESADYLATLLRPHSAEHVAVRVITPYEGPVALYLGRLAVLLGDRVAARHYFASATTLSDRVHAPVFAEQSRTALRTLADSGGVLTRREHDIARCVADGLTNRQIASQLFLSERTVENHVSHILRKLDTSTRAGIASRLQRVDYAGNGR